MTKEDRFWELEIDINNKKDLQKWINENSLVAIVDERAGGIIAYSNRMHNKEIIKILNKEEIG